MEIDVFEQKEEWIVTKEEPSGKVHVAIGKEEESRVFERTRGKFRNNNRVDLKPNIIKNPNEHWEKCYQDWHTLYIEPEKSDEVPKEYRQLKYEKTKIPPFFVQDLYGAEKYCKFFQIKDIQFCVVEICGTVTGTKQKLEKYSLWVDDGTASIECVIDESNIKNEKNDNKEKLKQLYSTLSQDPNSELIKASLMMCRSSKKILDQIPNVGGINKGELVSIFGTLFERSDGGRIIYVNKIKTEYNEQGHIKRVFEFYENAKIKERIHY